MNKNNETLIALNIAVWGTLLVISMIAMTGCAAPLLLGVKEITTAGGTQVKFITGGDFRIGANGVDTVEDNRGIKPSGQMPRLTNTKLTN